MTFDLVMDGSNRMTYKEKLPVFQDANHDTEAKGAFVKRW